MLASGSSGNAAIVGSGRTRLLIDAGLTAPELKRRLSRFDLGIEDLDGVVLTHEHGDHIAGVAALAGRWGRTIYLTAGTRSRLMMLPSDSRIVEIEAGRSFCIGSLRVGPFPLSHDAAEPVGFTFENEIGKIGYVTDLGKVTDDVRHGLSGCRVLAIEFNHDRELLLTGPYPPLLKKRILGDMGHLSNNDSAELLRSSAHEGLEWVFLAHLSRTNNHPETAHRAAHRVLAGTDAERANINVASQDDPGPWVTLDKKQTLW